MDNYTARKRVEIRNWLAAGNLRVHVNPTSTSWMNPIRAYIDVEPARASLRLDQDR